MKSTKVVEEDMAEKGGENSKFEGKQPGMGTH
jgi:hypothetical protein